MMWHEILPQLYLFEDSCNVYALVTGEGALVFNAGTGRWLERPAELPGKPISLFCTHYFRDHSAGAVKAAKAGIPVFVPEGELEIFADPAQHFRQRETYIIYDNLWDLYSPIEPVVNSRPFLDYERRRVGGAEIEAVPLPGVTLTQTGYAVTLGTGQRVVFCGETIHSPGKLARVSPFQYNYNDIGGAINCYYSASILRDRAPDALLPSLGDPILADVDSALAQLQEGLSGLVETCGRDADQVLELQALPPLTKVTEHVYLSTHSNARSWFLLGESGKVLTIDYGYNFGRTQTQAYPQPTRRRALLHGLDGLKEAFGVERIDVALLSHFHDDHVCGVPVLQRLFGTQCWASESFADLVAEPSSHRFPCTWHVPIRVDRRIPIDETVEWEQYTFHFAAMSGHTRFASLIGFEVDGKRFAHTGDQYFFRKPVTAFAENQIQPNHVYRNGAMLGGFAQSSEWMLKWRPDIVLTGHTDAIHTDEHYFRLIEEWTETFESAHRRIMELGDEKAHFDLDSWGGWIWPYRIHMPKPATANITVTVRNPLPNEALVELELLGPEGWEGSRASVTAGPRAEVACQMHITPRGPCRRQPFAVDLVVDGRAFGQVAEALVTVGGEAF